jgi:hypothetical protein
VAVADEPEPFWFVLIAVLVAVCAVIAIAQTSRAQITAKRIRMIRFSMRAPERTKRKEFSCLSRAKPAHTSSEEHGKVQETRSDDHAAKEGPASNGGAPAKAN